MKIDLADEKIEEVAADIGQRVGRTIGEQLSREVARYQQAASVAQSAEKEAKQVFDALTSRAALVRSELSELEKKLAARQSAFKTLYGENA